MMSGLRFPESVSLSRPPVESDDQATRIKPPTNAEEIRRCDRPGWALPNRTAPRKRGRLGSAAAHWVQPRRAPNPGTWLNDRHVSDNRFPLSKLCSRPATGSNDENRLLVRESPYREWLMVRITPDGPGQTVLCPSTLYFAPSTEASVAECTLKSVSHSPTRYARGDLQYDDTPALLAVRSSLRTKDI
jgi:hypothetical protein